MPRPPMRRARPPAIVLFARAPRGRVKTRLVPALGRDGALLLHRALVTDSRSLLARAARLSGATPCVAWSGGARTGPRTLRQGRGDLGARLRRVVSRLLRRGHRAVVVIGSDSPTLSPREVARGVRLLDRGPDGGGPDLVLGPARDGGYYLIGLRAAAPALFEGMPWGGRAVRARTLTRARGLGMRVALLRPWYDVDRPEDLARLRRDTAGSGRRRAPRTAAALALLSRARTGRRG